MFCLYYWTSLATRLDKKEGPHLSAHHPLSQLSETPLSARSAYHSNLNSANLNSINLNSTHLNSANLNSTNLNSTNFNSTHLNSANSTHSTQLRKHQLNQPQLNSANLNSSNLDSTNFNFLTISLHSTSVSRLRCLDTHPVFGLLWHTVTTTRRPSPLSSLSRRYHTTL